ncbi:hypothetical protein BKA65DRAFT_500038 [Rhexocercosporidium sp. MPI-PUGE-AT-0058]|nr:hypothetical protein BKA65DRAFT_500038 [Rhexocercosporidium sp. MPI-PUGE-AT-0058]
MPMFPILLVQPQVSHTLPIHSIPMPTHKNSSHLTSHHPTLAILFRSDPDLSHFPIDPLVRHLPLTHLALPSLPYPTHLSRPSLVDIPTCMHPTDTPGIYTERAVRRHQHCLHISSLAMLVRMHGCRSVRSA